MDTLPTKSGLDVSYSNLNLSPYFCKSYSIPPKSEVEPENQLSTVNVPPLPDEESLTLKESFNEPKGLEILLSRPRIEAKFMINGTMQIVSSVNKFYQILEPDPLDFAKVQAIYSLPLPNDIKKEINYYVGNRKKLYYRKKRVIPRNNYTSG